MSKLSRNWVLKVSALGIAILLWFSVRFEARNQQEISNVAVRIDLSDPAWTPVEGGGAGSVSVRFRGPALELLRLSSDRPVVVIPMTEVTSGDTLVVIQPGWVRFGERPGVIVEGINPGSVRLRFEPLQRRTLPPAIRLTGTLPEALALAAQPTASVRELRVSGARSLTLELDSIPLLPVDLSTLTASGAVTVRVDTTALRGVLVEPGELEVQFELESRGIRTFRLPAPVLPELLDGVPVAIEVQVTGAPSLLERLVPDALRLVAELPPGLSPEAESFELVISVEGLSPLLEAQVEAVPVRRRLEG